MNLFYFCNQHLNLLLLVLNSQSSYLYLNPLQSRQRFHVLHLHQHCYICFEFFFICRCRVWNSQPSVLEFATFGSVIESNPLFSTNWQRRIYIAFYFLVGYVLTFSFKYLQFLRRVMVCNLFTTSSYQQTKNNDNNISCSWLQHEIGS